MTHAEVINYHQLPHTGMVMLALTTNLYRSLFPCQGFLQGSRRSHSSHYSELLFNAATPMLSRLALFYRIGKNIPSAYCSVEGTMHRSPQPIPKPFLRWAGSKRKLIPQLRAYWNADGRYIEPFMGSACLFFAIAPERAVLGDINSELIDTFQAVRGHPVALSNALARLPTGRDSYYEIRQQDPNHLAPIIRAARFIYLNRNCFNGLYRTNANGHFNVPYSGARTGPLPSLTELRVASKTLSRADILCADFAQIANVAERGDFIYLDPPYAVSNRRIFRQYDPSSFGLHDLSRLAACLTTIDARGATFLVSYAICKEALEMFGQWNIRRVMTQRNISGFAKNRRRAVEILVSNRSHPK